MPKVQAPNQQYFDSIKSLNLPGVDKINLDPIMDTPKPFHTNVGLPNQGIESPKQEIIHLDLSVQTDGQTEEYSIKKPKMDLSPIPYIDPRSNTKTTIGLTNELNDRLKDYLHAYNKQNRDNKFYQKLHLQILNSYILDEFLKSKNC